MHWLRGGLLLAAAGLAGCGSRQAVSPPDETPPDTTTRLGDRIDVSLPDWLKLSRQELAEKVKEWTFIVAKQQEHARQNPESAQLLPQLRPAVTPPVFARASFSARAGFSLPPYLKEGATDPDLALHLARHGDREAALKVADPADGGLRARIDACRPEGAWNYPAEWTRLAGLVLRSAQFKLAEGQPEGATELVLLHQQVRAVLDAKAAAGPLGAALLPSGRRALTLAVAAWREPSLNKQALADDVDKALADWGEVPAPAPALVPGARQADAARLFGEPARGRGVAAHTPAAVRRALDLLALPLPAEEVQAVVALSDARGALTELLVVYGRKVVEVFPEPAQLAQHLGEHGFAGGPQAESGGVRRQTWKGGGLGYEVSRFLRGKAAGALVRVGDAQARPTPSFARDPRDFGAVHFDRTLEQNRINVAPEQAGANLTVTDPAALGRITQPVADPLPAAAVLQGEQGHDLLARLALRWTADVNPESVARLAVPLWAAYGSARVDGVDDANGGYLALTWEDGRTRLRLHVPYDEKAPEFVAEDTRGPAALAARAAAAARFDRDERQARLEAGRPRQRLRRSFATVNGLSLDGARLGATRAEALAALPRTPTIHQQPLADGVGLLFLEEPGPDDTHWARQVFIRFGPEDRVAEVRVLYQIGRTRSGSRAPTLLDILEAMPNGKPEVLAAGWARLWADLPPQSPAPVHYRWRDDTTVLTYQRDAGGAEVILRDCPADAPLGVPLPPLAFCSRGVDHCELGATRAAVTRHWKLPQPPPTAGGAVVLGQPDASPYQLVLVWFEGDKATRIVALHRAPVSRDPANMAAALQQAWSQDLDHLGYVRRRDGRHRLTLRAYGWHDDRTRVRLFIQDTEKGPQLFSEWRECRIGSKE
jgi:hypothetical protein